MNFGRAISIVFEGIEIDPISLLRVQFQVEKSDGESFNHGMIRIFNLNPSSRAALTVARPVSTILIEPIIKVYLYAGYEGNVKEVIAGDVFMSYSQRIGPDWITTIEIYSGIAAALNGVSTISFDGITNAKFIADQLIEPMGLSVDYTQEALDLLVQFTFEDFSESAVSMRSISQFLKRFDLEFTIEENIKGLVYKRNTPRDPDQARNESNAFNKYNGLVGSPNITRTGVEFTALLRPEIKLLQSIYVESQTINETLQKDENLTNKYFVKSISHVGDTHDDEWHTGIEAFYADLQDGTYA